jgi:hypothetical protein
MATCRTLTKDMLPHAIDVHTTEAEMNYDRARQIADVKAREKCEFPMLMAWYEKSTGAFSPQVECCSEDKPGWLVYAESRGGNIIVDINNQEFIFVYRDAFV